MQKAMNDQPIQPGEGILAIMEQSGYPWSRMAFKGIWKAITHNRKEVNMAFAGTEVKELEPMVKSGKKLFVRYQEGAELYSMGLHTFEQLAKEAGAIYKIRRVVLVNLDIFDEYLDTFRM